MQIYLRSGHYLTNLFFAGEVPRGTNTSDWFGSKTWNLYFKPSNIRQANIETAILR